jgi:hypothetical protein
MPSSGPLVAQVSGDAAKKYHFEALEVNHANSSCLDITLRQCRMVSVDITYHDSANAEKVQMFVTKGGQWYLFRHNSPTSYLDGVLGHTMHQVTFQGLHTHTITSDNHWGTDYLEWAHSSTAGYTQALLFDSGNTKTLVTDAAGRSLYVQVLGGSVIGMLPKDNSNNSGDHYYVFATVVDSASERVLRGVFIGNQDYGKVTAKVKAGTAVSLWLEFPHFSKSDLYEITDTDNDLTLQMPADTVVFSLKFADKSKTFVVQDQANYLGLSQITAKNDHCESCWDASHLGANHSTWLARDHYKALETWGRNSPPFLLNPFSYTCELQCKLHYWSDYTDS